MKKIALLGFGVVGGGTAEVLTKNQKKIAKYVGEEVEIKYILDLRTFPDSPFGHLVTSDFQKIINDSEIVLVAEMMGGIHPAYDFTKAALEAGKNVVTSNKNVVAECGVELMQIAKKHNVHYGFEASVGGGIPVLNPIQKELTGNEICSICGILNGTTNYILTRMKNDGQLLQDALKEAQSKGYAEADPTADVEGLDAARKVCILTALSYGVMPEMAKIPCKGIMQLNEYHTIAANAFHGAVKLVGYTTKKDDGKIYCDVKPRFVPATHPLSSVSDVNNAVCVKGDMVGNVMFYGPGAGKLPTASAVVADISSILANKSADVPNWKMADKDDMTNIYQEKYLLLFEGCKRCAEKAETSFGGKAVFVDGGMFAMITKEKMLESELMSSLDACGLTIKAWLPVLDG